MLKYVWIGLLACSPLALVAQQEPTDSTATRVDTLATQYLENVFVNATRVAERKPIAAETLTAEELEPINLGQDLPFLLRQTPNIVAFSDAGAGVGYTGFRMRGSDQTRINVTLDGVPVNDAESQAVFWVNLPNLASSLSSIKVQRGLGSATNGTADFGGSLNLQTATFQEQPGMEVGNTYGSFNTWRHEVALNTGKLGKGFYAQGRLTKQTSDGYVDRATSDLRSLFLTGGYQDDKTLVKINVISGRETTYQSWFGVTEEQLATDRTFNFYTYENQVDNYGQDYFQLHLAHDFSPEWRLSSSSWLTQGAGYFEEYEADQDLAVYGMEPFVAADTTISTSDLVRRRWLDNDYYGQTLQLKWQPSAQWTWRLGALASRYVGDHFGEVIWAEYAGERPIRHRFYENTSTKEELSGFLKATYHSASGLTAYLDLPVRWVGHFGQGRDLDGATPLGAPIDFGDDFLFFNPRVGADYALSTTTSLYLFGGVGHREPNRDDFLAASAENPPAAERLYNVETGTRYRADRVSVEANAYYMYYQDQLVQTGALNDVGAFVRRNVGESYRAGVELQGRAALPAGLQVWANLNLSQNRIAEFREVYVAGASGIEENLYQDSPIAFSPAVVAATGIDWSAFDGFTASFNTNYVGRQYLDNTGAKSRSLDPYFIGQLLLSYQTQLPEVGVKSLRFNLQVNNLWNTLYEPNGYAFSFYDGTDLQYGTGFYPQAGTHLLGSVTLGF